MADKYTSGSGQMTSTTSDQGWTANHVSTGVVLFSATGQLLFINQQAQVLLRQLHPGSPQEIGPALIPRGVTETVRALIEALAKCRHPKDGEIIQTERIMLTATHRMLVRGVCIPEEPLQKNSRFVVILEHFTSSEHCPSSSARERYHLTEREQTVIIYLMLGFTNKEIANRMDLSEYTVKEHLKRVMTKTQTTTRTGLLARMIFSAPRPVGAHQPVKPLETTIGLPLTAY